MFQLLIAPVNRYNFYFRFFLVMLKLVIAILKYFQFLLLALDLIIKFNRAFKVSDRIQFSMHYQDRISKSLLVFNNIIH